MKQICTAIIFSINPLFHYENSSFRFKGSRSIRWCQKSKKIWPSHSCLQNFFSFFQKKKNLFSIWTREGGKSIVMVVFHFYFYFIGSSVGFDNIYWAPTIPGTVLDAGNMKMNKTWSLVPKEPTVSWGKPEAKDRVCSKTDQKNVSNVVHLGP